MASVAEVYNLALRNQQGGNFAEAERLYRQVLAVDPGHADSLNQMGILAYQFGQLPAAADLFGRAVARNPRQATFLYHHGLALQELGRLAEAEAAYRKAIAVQATHPKAYNNLGNLLHTQGKLEESIAAYRKAAAQQPNYAEAHYNLGLLLQGMGQDEEAAAAYKRALRLKPDYAEGHNNLGNILQGQGRLDEAVASYRQAIKQNPQLLEPYNNLGGALHRLGRADEAMQVLQQALALAPNDANVHHNIGNVLQDKGQFAEAEAAYARALALKPDLAAAHSNLGNALHLQGKLDAAVASFGRAITLEPAMPEAHMNLGATLQDQGKLEAAGESFARAAALKPDFPDAGSNQLINMTYRSGVSPEALFEAHVRWGEAHAPAGPIPKHANSRAPDRKLKVGFVSADFRAHSVAFFLEPLLAARDRSALEVTCYSEVVQPDAVTERLHALSDHWRQVVGIADQAVAERVRADGIDVLIDLSGHTHRNRLPVFAHKAAPVQATWLGYPNTTGVRQIDYRLVDPVTDPPGEADAFAVEALVRMADGFLAYAPPADAPDVAPPPSAAGAPLTFGSFNNPTKLSDETIALWAALLARVPAARLLLKGKPFADEAARQLCEARFAAHGIAPDRLMLRSWLGDAGSHLATYGEVDIGLDPFPYNGTTTTCEAFWMGVPVVTLSGDRHAGRVGASLLTRVGLPELIARDPGQYLDIAAGLAADPARLADLRAGLRARMQASPLTDAPGFARAFEAALRGMWRGWCEARPPAPFEVGPLSEQRPHAG